MFVTINMKRGKMFIKDTVIISHERFLTEFYYNSETNIMKENLFLKFSLPTGIVVHKNLAVRLYSLIPVLENLNLKILFKDVFRPVEMQKYLYENWKERTGKEPKSSLADVDKAPHSRGIAFDCVLVDEKNQPLIFPSSSIKVNPEQRSPFFENFGDVENGQEKRNNRNLLRYMMLCVGISPINKEWFHFQLPQSLDYPVISIEDSQNAEKYNFDSRNTIEYYDIFHDYQNDIFENKTDFWVNNEKYFEQFSKISLEKIIEKLKVIQNG